MTVAYVVNVRLRGKERFLRRVLPLPKAVSKRGRALTAKRGVLEAQRKLQQHVYGDFHLVSVWNGVFFGTVPQEVVVGMVMVMATQMTKWEAPPLQKNVRHEIEDGVSECVHAPQAEIPTEHGEHE